MTEWDESWTSIEELDFEMRKPWERSDLFRAARKKNRDRTFSDYLRRGPDEAN
jgi:hypothetical protein